jgi:hypothetical protein
MLYWTGNQMIPTIQNPEVKSSGVQMVAVFWTFTALILLIKTPGIIFFNTVNIRKPDSPVFEW